MPKLYVHTAFTLRHDDGTLEAFPAGERDFPESVAAHWYVKHHTREPGDAPKPAAAPVDGAELAAAREALEAQAAQLSSAREDASKEAARLAGLRDELDTFGKDLDARAGELDVREATIVAREQEHVARAQEHVERVAAFEAAQKAQSDAGGQRGSGKKA
ncbi:STY1053 family phage-associated protein [Burkholderia cenocepacia]